MTKEATGRADREGKSSRFLLVTLGLFLILMLGATAFGAYLTATDKGTVVGGPILLVGGILMFMVVLSVVVVVFRRLGLANSQYALGLPDGSIRAFLALALLLMFFIIAFNVFGALKQIKTETLKNLTAEQVDQIPGEDIASIDRLNRNRFQVERIISPTESGMEIGQQILTTAATLVVALSSFYFGSSAVAQAAGVVPGLRRRGPTLRIVSPENFPVMLSKLDDAWEPITIKLELAPETETITRSLEGDPEGTVEKTGSQTFAYRPGAPSEQVKVIFSLVNAPDVRREATFQPPKGQPRTAD